MKKYTIADVLHLAADKYLNQNGDWFYKEKFSCNAVKAANEALGYPFKEGTLIAGLRALGCPCGSSNAFGNTFNKYYNEYDDDDWWNSDEKALRKVQAYRYSWLKFAALMAEEQGV